MKYFLSISVSILVLFFSARILAIQLSEVPDEKHPSLADIWSLQTGGLEEPRQKSGAVQQNIYDIDLYLLTNEEDKLSKNIYWAVSLPKNAALIKITSRDGRPGYRVPVYACKPSGLFEGLSYVDVIIMGYRDLPHTDKSVDPAVTWRKNLIEFTQRIYFNDSDVWSYTRKLPIEDENEALIESTVLDLNEQRFATFDVLIQLASYDHIRENLRKYGLISDYEKLTTGYDEPDGGYTSLSNITVPSQETTWLGALAMGAALLFTTMNPFAAEEPSVEYEEVYSYSM